MKTTTATDTKTTDEFNVEPILLHKAIYTLKAVNHKLRLSMLQQMHRYGSVPVTALYEQMNLEQSVASQHLAILRRHGFVNTRRQGKYIYYSVNYERLKDTESLCRQLLHKEVTIADILLDPSLV